MKISTQKKEIEKLYDSKSFHELFKLFAICSSKEHADRFKNLLSNSKIDLSKEQTKRYVVNEIIKTIRMHNIDEDYKNFKPHVEKKSFFKQKQKFQTKEEMLYSKLFKSNIKMSKNNWQGKISEEAYQSLKQLYELDKDDYYIGIHRTNFFVDDIFEEGLRFGSDTNINELVQRMDNFDVMLDEISKCEGYKNSYGCFIIKVPRKDVVDKDEPIYYMKDDTLYLNPKYVVAYAPVKNKKVLPIEMNEQMDIVSSTVYEGENVNISGKRNRFNSI